MKEEAVGRGVGGLQLEGCGSFKGQSESWLFKSVSVSPDVSGRAGHPAVYRPAAPLTPRSSERRGRRVRLPLKGWRPNNSQRGVRSLPPITPLSLRLSSLWGRPHCRLPLPSSHFPASPGSQQPAASSLPRPWPAPAGSPSRAPRPLASWGPFLWPVPTTPTSASQPPRPFPGPGKRVCGSREGTFANLRPGLKFWS